MDKMNKILYCVILFFIPWLGKFLNGRTVPGVVQLVLWFIGIGWIIGIIEMFFVIFTVHRPEGSSDIEIPKGFFDFLAA